MNSLKKSYMTLITMIVVLMLCSWCSCCAPPFHHHACVVLPLSITMIVVLVLCSPPLHYHYHARGVVVLPPGLHHHVRGAWWSCYAPRSPASTWMLVVLALCFPPSITSHAHGARTCARDARAVIPPSIAMFVVIVLCSPFPSITIMLVVLVLWSSPPSTET